MDAFGVQSDLKILMVNGLLNWKVKRQTIQLYIDHFFFTLLWPLCFFVRVVLLIPRIQTFERVFVIILGTPFCICYFIVRTLLCLLLFFSPVQRTGELACYEYIIPT